MNLTIDIGNTQTKAIVFDDTNPVYRVVAKSLTPSLLRKINRSFSIRHVLVSSVIKIDSSIRKELNIFSQMEMLTSHTRLPIKNRYKTPSTLGNDRLSNAVAGAFLFPKKNVLIIDIGTCIKFDFINSKNEYLGGSISPGMGIRFKALHQFTGKLPLVNDTTDIKLTGTTTQQAIQSGVLNGMTEEIKGIVLRYRKLYKTLTVIITGGQADRFAGQLKISIFAAPDMVNLGLNEIIRFNRTA